MKPEEIIVGFVSTEKAIRLMQNHNTITVYVNPRANKKQIKEAIEKLFGVKVKKVNTLNAPNNLKKAYVRLEEGYSAMEVYQKVGLL